MTHFYDLVVSNRLSDNSRRLVSIQRMSKEDAVLTDEEIYSILYKAVTDLDKTAEQAAVYTLMPKKEYSLENKIQLNMMLNTLAYLGSKVELIEVLNTTSDQADVGILCYMKLETYEGYNNVYKANLYSYTDENTTITEIEWELADLVIASPQLKDIMDLPDIGNTIQANKRLQTPYYSVDLDSILKSFGVQFEVIGEF